MDSGNDTDDVAILDGETEERQDNETKPSAHQSQYQQESDLEASDSFNSSGNRSNDTICPQLSPSSTTHVVSSKEHFQKETFAMTRDGLTSHESEKLIVELITQSAWLEAVRTFTMHKKKWPETFALDFENHIGTLGEEEDLYAMLNMYCKHLTEIRIIATQPMCATSSSTSMVDSSTCSIFVMTLTDIDMANNVSRLMDASLQLLATVKLMETQLTKRKQSMSAQAVATVTERVYKQQEQITQEIQQHHAQQQILQQQQELHEKQLLLEEKQQLLQEETSEVPISTSDQIPAHQDEQFEEATVQPLQSSSPQPEVTPTNETDEKLESAQSNNEQGDEIEQDTEMTETMQSSL